MSLNGRKIHFHNEINHLGASWVCIIIQRENNTEMSKKKMIFHRVIVENYKNIGIRNSSNIMK